MKKKILFPAFVVLVTAFLLFGCSDKSNNNGITEGDYSNEDYLLARAEADSVMGDIQTDNFGARDWICRVPMGPHPPHPDSVSYDSTSGWHVWEFSREDSIVQVAVSDSFRFTDLNSNYQRFRDSTTNIFERRLKRNLHAERGRINDGTEWTRNMERNTVWDGLAEPATTLNGDFSRLWSGESDWRDFEKTVDGQMTDILFHTSDLRPDHRAYPYDGTFEASMIMNVTLPRRQVHMEAELTITFFDGGYNAHLQRGDRFWDWTHYWPE